MAEKLSGKKRVQEMRLPKLTRLQFAKLMKVSLKSLDTWRRTYGSDMPEEDEDGYADGREMVRWYFVNREGDKPRNQLVADIYAAMGKRFKSPIPEEKKPEPEKKPDGRLKENRPPKEPTEKDLLEIEGKKLDLRAKAAKVEREMGQHVPTEKVRAAMQSFAAKMADTIESVKRVTGHPVESMFEQTFESFFEDLKAIEDGGYSV